MASHDSKNSLQKAAELKQRTKGFAIRIVRLFRSLPHTPDAQTLGRQVMRSGTSVAANYRAVCRARSKAEFISKMGVVVEEADESVFWLELLVETGVLSAERTQDLLREANELLAIFGASLRTSKLNQCLNDSMTQQANSPLLPTPSDQYRSSSARAARHRALPELRPGGSSCARVALRA